MSANLPPRVRFEGTCGDERWKVESFSALILYADGAREDDPNLPSIAGFMQAPNSEHATCLTFSALCEYLYGFQRGQNFEQTARGAVMNLLEEPFGR